MDVSKIKPLLDAVAQLEPPVLGHRLNDLEECVVKLKKRLDMFEEGLRLLNERTSQVRRDFVELREWVVLKKVKGGGSTP